MNTHHSSNLFTMAALMAGVITVLGAELSEESQQTYELNKTGAVTLENVNGSVHVTAWDREEIKVEAVKRAKTQKHLDEVEIDVQSKPDQIQIKTKYPDRENSKNSASVEYTLTVPRDSELKKISTVNGRVEIEGVRGDVEASSVNGQVSADGLLGQATLSTVNGSVKAKLDELLQPVSLKSVNGSVTVVLPPDANADVSASTLNGGISCDFPITIKRSFPLGQKLEGKLGEGGPMIKMSSVNGGIHIDRMKTVLAEEE